MLSWHHLAWKQLLSNIFDRFLRSEETVTVIWLDSNYNQLWYFGLRPAACEGQGGLFPLQCTISGYLLGFVYEFVFLVCFFWRHPRLVAAGGGAWQGLVVVYRTRFLQGGMSSPGDAHVLAKERSFWVRFWPPSCYIDPWPGSVWCNIWDQSKVFFPNQIAGDFCCLPQDVAHGAGSGPPGIARAATSLPGQCSGTAGTSTHLLSP